MSNSTIKRIAFVISLCVLLVPYQTEYAPEWKIRVVDKKRNAKANISVEQEHYYINFLSSKKELKSLMKMALLCFLLENLLVH